MNVVGRVDGKWNAVERHLADGARKAERMESFARRAQQLLRDRLIALCAFFQRVLKPVGHHKRN